MLSSAGGSGLCAHIPVLITRFVGSMYNSTSLREYLRHLSLSYWFSMGQEGFYSLDVETPEALNCSLKPRQWGRPIYRLRIQGLDCSRLSLSKNEKWWSATTVQFTMQTCPNIGQGYGDMKKQKCWCLWRGFEAGRTNYRKRSGTNMRSATIHGSL